MKSYIIAEMASSHDAKKIIKASGDAGADAIQFQMWELYQMLVPTHTDYHKQKKLNLNQLHGKV